MLPRPSMRENFRYKIFLESENCSHTIFYFTMRRKTFDQKSWHPHIMHEIYLIPEKFWNNEVFSILSSTYIQLDFTVFFNLRTKAIDWFVYLSVGCHSLPYILAARGNSLRHQSIFETPYPSFQSNMPNQPTRFFFNSNQNSWRAGSPITTQYCTSKLARAKLLATACSFICSSHVRRPHTQFTCITCILPVKTGKFNCVYVASTSLRIRANRITCRRM